MNTKNANKYLDSLQISERSIYDRKDIEHPLDCLLEDYHREQLKLLGIGGVIECLQQVNSTLERHGKIDANTDLHNRIRNTL